MAKKVAAPGTSPFAPRLAGKVFAFGKVGTWYKDKYARLIAAEGGTVLPELTEEAHYLLVPSRTSSRLSPAEKRAELLNAKKGARIECLDLPGLHALFAPTREEALTLLAAGEEGAKRWNALRCAGPTDKSSVPMPSLVGADLRKAVLPGIACYGTSLDGADLRGANLRGAHLDKLKGTKLDGACLADGWVMGMVDCSAKNADFTDGGASPVERVDLTGAKLERARFIQAKGATFARAHLAGARLEEAKFADCDFTGADLTGANLKEADLRKATLVRATLAGAQMEKCDLREANLTRADLSGADLTRAKVKGADLTGANLRGVSLSGVDLTGATVAGADFTGANLIGAKLPAALDKAKGLDKARKQGGKAGPHLRELNELAGASKHTTTSVLLQVGPNRASISMAQTNRKGAKASLCFGWHLFTPQGERYDFEGPRSFAGGLLALGNKFAGADVWLGSVTVESNRKPRGKELADLAAAAWCEAFGLEVLPAEELARTREEWPERRQRLQEEALAELRGGPAGVARWNARVDSDELKTICPTFADVDLSGAAAAGARFRSLRFLSAKLDGAQLPGSGADNANFTSSSFQNANLEGSHWSSSSFGGADFTGANLRACSCRCGFEGATFQKADLSGSKFTNSAFQGADLSGAKLEGCNFQGARYDEHTRFPPSTLPPDGMRWVGKGENPHLRAILDAPLSSTDLDVETFMERLRGNVEAGRLANALKMLKAERFQLYAQVEPNQLVGIVKSQTVGSRLYSCRLAADGSFSCCTQNLLPCGGLAGRICKHLLVLVVGLVKSGQANAALVDRWVEASGKQRPLLDADAMSATFLRYKGAESGEIDWRPTETIPEDYYAL